MDNEKERGLFWLPNKPDEKVEGVVTRNAEGGTILTAYGQLGPFGFEGRQQGAIHGRFPDSCIKLVNCLATNQRMNVDGFSDDQTTWHCQFAFRGSDYNGHVPNRIKSVEAVIELLGDWVPGFEGIKLSQDRSSLSWPPSQPDLSARWNLGNVAIRQEILPSWKSARHGVKTATVTTYTSVRVTFDQPQTWETAAHIVLSLQGLVSIAKGEAVNVERVSIVEEGKPDARLGASYNRVLHSGTQQIPHSELLTMDELGGVEGIAKWLNALHGQETLMTALLVDRYRQPAFITDRTSHLLAAGEAYQRHRMTDPQKWIRDLWAEVLEPMLVQAGRSFKEWMGRPEDWKDKISDVRNNYGVGHLQGYRSGSSTQPDFHLINQQLYLLVVLCLLSECGVSEDVKNEVVKRMRSDWKIRL